MMRVNMDDPVIVSIYGYGMSDMSAVHPVMDAPDTLFPIPTTMIKKKTNAATVWISPPHHT